MAAYYHTSLRKITEPEIPGLCNELLAAAGYGPDENFELSFFKWFGWFFHEVPPKKLLSSHFLPGSTLTTRIEKITSQPLCVLLQEVASHNHEILEGHANTTVLSFFKRIARKHQK